MRVWLIPPSVLDSRRLVAAHEEIHMCSTVLINGSVWGQSRSLETHYSFLQYIHETTLIEMATRNHTIYTKDGKLVYRDNTPLPDQPHLDTGGLYTPTDDLIRKDIRHLRQKWTLEGCYFGTGRTDLCELEEKYGLPVGFDKDQALVIQQETKDLVKQYKLWFDAFRVMYSSSRFQDRLIIFKHGLENNLYGVRAIHNLDRLQEQADAYGVTTSKLLMAYIKKTLPKKVYKDKLAEQDWT